MYDIKKIMRGIVGNEETQIPAIRFEVVMDCIPEHLQAEVELALKDFEKKAKGIVTAATDTIPYRLAK